MPRDYSETFNRYPSERTMLPDETNPLLFGVALATGASVAYLVSPALPYVPPTATAALTSPIYTLLAYVMLHMASGRRWVVECGEK